MPIFGDVTGDDTRGIADLVAMRSHINGKQTLTEEQLSRADTNGDGIVDDDDLNYVENYLAETDSKTYYFDPTEISGEFRFQLLTNNAQNIESNLPIINTNGSFTKLDTTITTDGDDIIFTTQYNKPGTGESAETLTTTVTVE